MSKSWIDQSDYDNWNGGTYGYTITFVAPSSLFNQLDSRIVSKLEEEFKEKASDFARAYDNQYIQRVRLVCALDVDEEWREKATDWVMGKGITNQGRARSDNLA